MPLSVMAVYATSANASVEGLGSANSSIQTRATYATTAGQYAI